MTHFCASFHNFRDANISTFLRWKFRVRSLHALSCITLALTIFEILRFEVLALDSWNFRFRSQIQHSKKFLSMTNIDSNQSHYWAFFASSHRFPDIIIISYFVYLENVEQGYFARASFDGKYMTSFFMAVLMSALSLTIYEIFTNQIKCPKFYFENEGNGQR